MAYSQLSYVLLVELLKITRSDKNLTDEERSVVMQKLRKEFQERFHKEMAVHLSRDITCKDFDIENYLNESLLPELDQSQIEIAQKRKLVPAACASVLTDTLLCEVSQNEISFEAKADMDVDKPDIKFGVTAEKANLSARVWQQAQVLDQLLTKVEKLDTK